jgi:hypothetical protein
MAMTRKRKTAGNTGETVPSQRALSRRLRVSRSTIDRLIKDGLKADSHGEYSVDQAQQLQRVRALRMRDATADSEERREGALQLKEARLRVDLEMAEHKLAVAREEYIPRDTVILEWRRAAVSVKNRFLGLGREMAPHLAGKGPREIESLINQRVFEILRLLARQGEDELIQDPSVPGHATSVHNQGGQA